MRGYAAIRKKPTFATRNVHITADLPCEEREYESGVTSHVSLLLPGKNIKYHDP